MKKVIFLMAAIFIVTIALALHPLLAGISTHSNHWDNVTDNRTMGVITVIGGGKVDIQNTELDGAHFGMGVVANRMINGHFTYMSDNLNINCDPQEMFDAICGERASFTCVQMDDQDPGVYFVEVFAGDHPDTTRGFISIFADGASYDSISPLEEGPVLSGMIKVECRGRGRGHANVT